jgi:hypothetical protein
VLVEVDVEEVTGMSATLVHVEEGKDPMLDDAEDGKGGVEVLTLLEVEDGKDDKAGVEALCWNSDEVMLRAIQVGDGGSCLG